MVSVCGKVSPAVAGRLGQRYPDSCDQIDDIPGKMKSSFVSKGCSSAGRFEKQLAAVRHFMPLLGCLSGDAPQRNFGRLACKRLLNAS